MKQITNKYVLIQWKQSQINLISDLGTRKYGFGFVPLFWGLFTFKSHLKSHAYGVIVIERFHVLIIRNNEFRRTHPVTST